MLGLLRPCFGLVGRAPELTADGAARFKGGGQVTSAWTERTPLGQPPDPQATEVASILRTQCLRWGCESRELQHASAQHSAPSSCGSGLRLPAWSFWSVQPPAASRFAPSCRTPALAPGSPRTDCART